MWTLEQRVAIAEERISILEATLDHTQKRCQKLEWFVEEASRSLEEMSALCRKFMQDEDFEPNYPPEI